MMRTSDESAVKVECETGPDLERVRLILDDYMFEKGLRSTEQRRVILDTFLATSEHLSIGQLLSRVRKVDPRVGYATVYRTVRLLSEAGIVQENQFGEGAARYEIANDDAHHDHMICETCGLIIEFEEPFIEQLQSRIAIEHGFVLTHHKHQLYGRCTDDAACAERRESGRSKVEGR